MWYGTCRASKQQGATAGCLAPTLQGVSPSSGMGNVAYTAKLWLTVPRNAPAICYGTACPHRGATDGSQDPHEHGHGFRHQDPHAPQPRGAGRGARCTGETLTMVVSVTEPKLLMKMLHVTLTGGPGKQQEASSHGWPGRCRHRRGTWGDVASCTSIPLPVGSPSAHPASTAAAGAVRQRWPTQGGCNRRSSWDPGEGIGTEGRGSGSCPQTHTCLFPGFGQP